jgi:class 3 adenylate cyclase/tetratricopeptide (TPR) repeat protein
MTTGARRLAAIMFTDMVGFTALAQANEAQALELLEEHRRLLRPEFEHHRGTEVKSVGDGFLVEFDSALEATNCAIRIQQRLSERNQRTGQVPLRVRIGIHLGDVVHENGDVLGDSVNIASRIEPLADASGICISGPVFEQVGNKIPYPCTPLEHRLLKNVDSPLRLYAIELPGSALPAARVTPWVDRVRELEHLEPLVADAIRGHGRVVGLAGEPGVGKTRCAEELIRRAQRAGATVLRARAFPQGLGAPYSLWAEAVRAYLREAPPPLLYKVCAGCTNAVTTLAPELSERFAPAAARPEPLAESDQLDFFEEVSTFFRNLSKESPIVVLLDDVQWADTGSVRLLGYLAPRVEETRTLLLVTYRDSDVEASESLRATLSDLHRQRRVVVVRLQRLDAENGTELVRAALAAERTAPDLVAQVLRQTGGNPFFVEEVVRSLLEEDQIERAGGGWRLRPGAHVALPPTVGEVLRRRTRHLSPEAQETLLVASVLSSEFPFELLRAVTGVDEERLLHQVEQMLRARILREREVVPGRSVYDFGDEQIREVLYQDLSLVRRQRLHHRAAEALAGGTPARVEETAYEIASHFLLGGDPGRATEYAVRAARHAQAVYSHEEAIRAWRRALEGLDQVPDDDLRVTVLLALGEEQVAVLQPDGAERNWAEALALLDRAGRRRAMADVHRRLGYLYRQYFQQNDRALVELHQALGLLATEPEGPELAQVYGDLADLLWYEGRVEEAKATCEQALAIAGRTGASDVEGWAYLLLASMVRPEEKENAFRYLERMLAVGVEHGLPDVRVGAIQNLSIILLEVRGDWRGAERLLLEGVDFARSVKSLSAEMTLRTRFLPLILLFGGEVDRARALAQEMLDYMARFSRTPEPLPLFILGRVAALRSETGPARDYLRRALTILDAAPDWTVRMLCLDGLARVEAADGQTDRALAQLVACRGEATKAGESAFFGQHYCSILTGLVDYGLSAHPPATEVASWVAELEALATRLDTDPSHAHLSRALGLVAAKDGRPAEAARLLERSAELWTKVDWPFEAGTVEAELAGVYADLGDSEAAERHRAAAHVHWSRLGIPPR